MHTAHPTAAADFELEEYLSLSRVRELAYLAGGGERADAADTERELRGEVDGLAGYGEGEDAAAAEGSAFEARYGRLNEVLGELLEDFGLVGYMPLQVEVRVPAPLGKSVWERPVFPPHRALPPPPQDQECMQRLVGALDKANGYVFAQAVVDEMEASQAAALSQRGKQGAAMAGAAAARAMGSFIASADTSFESFVRDVSERYSGTGEGQGMGSAPT